MDAARVDPAGRRRTPERGARGRWWKALLGCLATAIFVWLLARGLDFAAVGRAFAQLSLAVIPVALAFLAAGYALRIVRWWWMLRVLEPGLPLRACVWPFLASIAVNNVLPLRAGDALRILGFQRELRSPAMRVAGTVVIERIMDLVVLCGFLLVGLLGLPAGAVPRGLVATTGWLAGLGAVALIALILFPVLWTRLGDWLKQRFADGRHWLAALLTHVQHLTEALAQVRSSKRLFMLLGITVAVWGCEGAVFAAMAWGLDTGAGPLAPWLSLATGTLATLLPSAPGHIGTFDYFAAQGLAAGGAAPETAAAFALAVHALLWAPLTALGLGYLAIRSGRLLGPRADQEQPS